MQLRLQTNSNKCPAVGHTRTNKLFFIIMAGEAGSIPCQQFVYLPPFRRAGCKVRVFVSDTALSNRNGERGGGKKRKETKGCSFFTKKIKFANKSNTQ